MSERARQRTDTERRKRTDKELFDLGERNPEEVMRVIQMCWAQCGHGFREEFFNFRHCFNEAIDAAMDREEKLEARNPNAGPSSIPLPQENES